MRKFEKAAEITCRVIDLIWYCGILAVYVFSLIQASTVEVPELVGIVLILWPFILLLSVRTAKRDVLTSVPSLIERPIDGWGALIVPKAWQIENGNVLVCRNQTYNCCAILYKSNEMQTSRVLDLPDHATVTIQLPQKALSAETGGVFRCYYTIGKQKRAGYVSIVRTAGVFSVAAILRRGDIGKYIAEAILDEI